MSSSLTMAPVTAVNWRAALELTVRPGQAEFVPSVLVSLAKAYVRPDDQPVHPFLILRDAEPIGFWALTCNPISADGFWINGFLIDRNHQGRGNGRRALAAIIDYIRREFPHCERINLTVSPGNAVARRLYAAAGFADTGQSYEGEMIYALALSR